VAEVCRRLDGIPLAIELAAARVKVLSPEQIAARLDDRFRLLTAGSRTVLPRQRTLRGAIDWSHGLLPGQERLLLRRLAVFAGDWTVEAAERVCSGDGVAADEVLDLLAQLVRKSLVLAEDQDNEMCYRFLETIRQYAEEELRGAGEEAVLRGRHCAWFLDLVERAELELVGLEQTAWLERLEREHDNLRGALRWAVERGEAEMGPRLGAVLWRFWWVHGRLSEGQRWLEAALSQDAGALPIARAKALKAERPRSGARVSERPSGLPRDAEPGYLRKARTRSQYCYGDAGADPGPMVILDGATAGGGKEGKPANSRAQAEGGASDGSE
jgi:predicted ATPase